LALVLHTGAAWPAIVPMVTAVEGIGSSMGLTCFTGSPMPARAQLVAYCAQCELVTITDCSVPRSQALKPMVHAEPRNQAPELPMATGSGSWFRWHGGPAPPLQVGPPSISCTGPPSVASSGTPSTSLGSRSSSACSVTTTRNTGSTASSPVSSRPTPIEVKPGSVSSDAS
jgi:hypothetical protein